MFDNLVIGHQKFNKSLINKQLMIKAAIEKVINEDMAEIWSILNGDEKRLIVDNFNVQTFKKNQFIYAEGDEPNIFGVC